MPKTLKPTTVLYQLCKGTMEWIRDESMRGARAAIDRVSARLDEARNDRGLLWRAANAVARIAPLAPSEDEEIDQFVNECNSYLKASPSPLTLSPKTLATLSYCTLQYIESTLSFMTHLRPLVAPHARLDGLAERMHPLSEVGLAEPALGPVHTAIVRMKEWAERCYSVDVRAMAGLSPHDIHVLLKVDLFTRYCDTVDQGLP